VERQFEIIGEGLNQLLRREPDLKGKISDASMFIAFRNRLIHGYATVSDEVVRGVVEGYLPVLSGEVRDLPGGGGGTASQDRGLPAPTVQARSSSLESGQFDLSGRRAHCLFLY